jgi:tripartite-type tricarboxylate transporter receptor subunit TctC
MSKYPFLIVVLFMILLFSMYGCTSNTNTDISPSEFFKGKTIDLVTTGSPGGYDDLVAHIVSSYLEKDTGSTVTIVNKKGSSGMEGINYVYSDEPDGLTLGNVAAAKFVSNKIMKEPGATYDIGKISYIMSIGHEFIYFFVSPESSYQSVANLKNGKTLKIGASSPSGNITLGGLTVIKLLNLDAKVVTGFESESDRALAVKRGEIVGYCLNLAGVKASISAGLIKPLFVLASQRDPQMPDIPAITELVNLSDEDLELVNLWETSFVSSTLYTAPPGLPQDRLVYLQSLSDKWLKDQRFRDEVNKVAGYEIKQCSTGEELNKNMSDLASNLEKFHTIFSDLTNRYRN